MHSHMAALRALEHRLKAKAKRAMEGGASPFLGVLMPPDAKIATAELLFAIGEACGEASTDLERQEMLLLDRIGPIDQAALEQEARGDG